MSKKHTYVLGINAYDHDVSACLLRDGEIAFAICKERITREKHATGFYAGSRRLLPEGRRHHAGRRRSGRAQLLRPPRRGHGRAAHLRGRARVPGTPRSESRLANSPFYLTKSDKIVPVSHHLAHAYSAFAASPFEEGVVMVVDGVGNYCVRRARAGPAHGGRQPARARIRELLPVPRLQARGAEESVARAGARLHERRVLLHAGARRALQPGLELHLRRLEQVRRGDGARPLRAPGHNKAAAEHAGRRARACRNGRPSSTSRGLFEEGDDWEGSQASPALGGPGLARPGTTPRRCCSRAPSWLRETTGAKNLCIAGGVGLNCVANGRLAREAGFDNVWIQPAAGDDGIAIGCAYYGHLALQRKPRTFVMKHAFLGESLWR